MLLKKKKSSFFSSISLKSGFQNEKIHPVHRLCSIFFQKLYFSIPPPMVWTAYHTDYYCCETRDPQQSTNDYGNDNANS